MLVAGDQIDVWIVERALGSGGMGSVYRCRNRNANRISAAVKVLDSDLRRFPEAEARFIREAEILFRLDHPNIVKVRNVRTDLDPPFLEMEFVEGESLESMLERGAVPLPRAKSLMAQLASALAYLHACGIRHRDIKPANVLIKADGRLVVVDFGLAMEAGASRLTQNNLAFGTVSYAPPEWLAPETLDAAKWDVYAAGVVFYEMLTGIVAFPVAGVGNARQQAAQVIFSKQGHAPLDPGDAFPEALRAVVRDATHSDAEKRIPDGRTLLDRLRVADPDVSLPSGWDARPPPSPLPSSRPKSGETLNFHREPDPPTLDRSSPASRDRAAAPGDRAAQPSRSRPWLWVAGLGAGAAFLAAGLVATVAILGWALSRTPELPTTRTVIARIEGLPPEVPVVVRLNGGTPTAVDGSDWTFPAAPGDAVVTWAIGEGCVACPGASCPAWCGVGEQRLAIPAGAEPFPVAVSLAPPAPRPVALRLPALDRAVPVSVSLGEHIAVRDGEVARVHAVLPGEYPLDVHIGTCPADARGCDPDRACPPGCVSRVASVVVPWGEGPWESDLGLPAPAPAAAAAPAPAPAAAPAPVAAPRPAAPAPASGRAGGLVTVGQFARWLAANPEWQAGTVTAGGYLPGWTGAAPPDGAAAGAPVTSTTWGAARAYCAGRGGLAALDAEPRTWSGDPQLEWRRSEDGKFAWRTNDGQTSTTGSANRAIGGVGFRCASR